MPDDDESTTHHGSNRTVLDGCDTIHLLKSMCRLQWVGIALVTTERHHEIPCLFPSFERVLLHVTLSGTTGSVGDSGSAAERSNLDLKARSMNAVELLG